jgi:hypothetical protein
MSKKNIAAKNLLALTIGGDFRAPGNRSRRFPTDSPAFLPAAAGTGD